MLEVRKVSKFFGRRCVLKDISLTVHGASITLLMGVNGAGKSTLLRIMAGLTTPSLGHIIHRVDQAHRAYLGHSTFLYPALTAWENLLFWANMYGLHKGKGKSKDKSASLKNALSAVLERVELTPFAQEKAGVFSRGMAQRLSLARILLLQPKLWLLDEPSTGLDVHSGTLLRREVCAARDAGAGIVWISHDKKNDAPLADRLAYIEKARLIIEPHEQKQGQEKKECVHV